VARRVTSRRPSAGRALRGFLERNELGELDLLETIGLEATTGRILLEDRVLAVRLQPRRDAAPSP